VEEDGLRALILILGDYLFISPFLYVSETRDGMDENEPEKRFHRIE
jgi:hypothetical protein